MYGRRQQSILVQDSHLGSMLVLFVLHIDSGCTWICFYLSGTVSSLDMPLVGLSDQDGRAGPYVFFLVSLISSALGEEAFATGAFAACRTPSLQAFLPT